MPKFVSIDRASNAGLSRQGAAADASVQLHDHIDVTGVLDRLARWSPRTAIDDADVAALLDAPMRDVRPRLSGPFDAAASTCLLSQLIASVVNAVGAAHPRFVAIVQAVRTAHLRLLCDLVAPGGLGVLISDVVSSESFPPLSAVREDQLSGVLGRLIEQGNFFHGVNPAAIHQTFRTDEILCARVAGLQSQSPWAVEPRHARVRRLGPDLSPPHPDERQSPLRVHAPTCAARR